MSERLARKTTIENYLAAFDGKWTLVNDTFDCDVCVPLAVHEINSFVKSHKAGEFGQPPPWFCEAHARKWNLLW